MTDTDAKTTRHAFLTIQQAADLLQVSRPTIYRLFGEGLPYIKVGKTTRIFSADLYRYALHHYKTIQARTETTIQECIDRFEGRLKAE